MLAALLLACSTEAALSLKHVLLDRLNIEQIDNLDPFTECEVLYLQQVRITVRIDCDADLGAVT